MNVLWNETAFPLCIPRSPFIIIINEYDYSAVQPIKISTAIGRPEHFVMYNREVLGCNAIIISALPNATKGSQCNKVSSWRDVTLLARRMLPLVSYVVPWSVTDADRRQMHGEQNNTDPPPYIMCRRASNITHYQICHHHYQCSEKESTVMTLNHTLLRSINQSRHALCAPCAGRSVTTAINWH